MRSRLPGAIDLHTRREIHTALADAGMPFDGDSTHPVGKPDVTYQRVNYERLKSNFGEHAANSMGRAWRGPNGTVWGETVKDEIGRDLIKNWENAKKHCLNLNHSSELKKNVEKYLERIEENTELRQLRDQYRKNKSPKNRKALLKKYNEIKNQAPGVPASGIFLAPLEEYLMLAVDLGYVEDQGSQYLPQVLPRLFESQYFWSGSAHPQYRGYAMIFDGGDGGIATELQGIDKSFRCAGVEAGVF